MKGTLQNPKICNISDQARFTFQISDNFTICIILATEKNARFLALGSFIKTVHMSVLLTVYNFSKQYQHGTVLIISPLILQSPENHNGSDGVYFMVGRPPLHHITLHVNFHGGLVNNC